MESQSYTLQPLATPFPVRRDHIDDIDSDPIPSVGRTQALARYIADSYVPTSPAPPSPHSPRPANGCQTQGEHVSAGRVCSGDVDRATLILCVERVLREAFPPAEVMAEMWRALVDEEYHVSPYGDWERAGKMWHVDEVDRVGSTQRVGRTLLNGEAAQHPPAVPRGTDLRGAMFLLHPKYVLRDRIAFWADAVWACRTGTHFAKPPRRVFDLVVEHVGEAPLIVPWLFEE
ncbi:hypothetical protein BDK51DRAFT_40697 [Blyttiomyces helicus]|uniref:Uncharacterized protein n=1 Tax=Blyttiomyces helicus TaxID=388810 RepID=A0A4P9WEY2_9FUNG|nr:hypothetical protein BDK51DRAFT_40697 [Blyttiomyces helicus]|eukprot:RKO90365.1 hypothetical protein BDK51DRAFT_40697 [Blyttiomyces helicus]